MNAPRGRVLFLRKGGALTGAPRPRNADKRISETNRITVKNGVPNAERRFECFTRKLFLHGDVYGFGIFAEAQSAGNDYGLVA